MKTFQDAIDAVKTIINNVHHEYRNTDDYIGMHQEITLQIQKLRDGSIWERDAGVYMQASLDMARMLDE